jgi:hypothetical protein
MLLNFFRLAGLAKVTIVTYSFRFSDRRHMRVERKTPAAEFGRRYLRHFPRRRRQAAVRV